jgi:hypothetical protein
MSRRRQENVKICLNELCDDKYDYGVSSLEK